MASTFRQITRAVNGDIIESTIEVDDIRMRSIVVDHLYDAQAIDILTAEGNLIIFSRKQEKEDSTE